MPRGDLLHSRPHDEGSGLDWSLVKSSGMIGKSE